MKKKCKALGTNGCFSFFRLEKLENRDAEEGVGRGTLSPSWRLG